jgi:hypothetical protein
MLTIHVTLYSMFPPVLVHKLHGYANIDHVQVYTAIYIMRRDVHVCSQSGQ